MGKPPWVISSLDWIVAKASGRRRSWVSEVMAVFMGAGGLNSRVAFGELAGHRGQKTREYVFEEGAFMCCVTNIKRPVLRYFFSYLELVSAPIRRLTFDQEWISYPSIAHLPSMLRLCSFFRYSTYWFSLKWEDLRNWILSRRDL